jgi:pimeloyl-ACP methyl ester carboxylesterase
MRQSTIRLETGPALHVVEHGDADGQPILFLHGWPDSWYSFSRVLEHLPARFRAIVPDQRGFGESDHPASGYTIADFAGDAAALLDAIHLERVAVVGHSFGTFVARRLAITRPERVSRLVLIASGVVAGTAPVRGARAALQTLPDSVPESFAREFQSSTVHAPVPEAFFDRIVTESMKLPGPLWGAILDGLLAYDDRAERTRIAVPTLLLWGEHDALFPRAHQDELVAAISRARLTVYPDTGHCPNWERPADVAADVQKFLDERL